MVMPSAYRFVVTSACRESLRSTKNDLAYKRYIKKLGNLRSVES